MNIVCLSGWAHPAEILAPIGEQIRAQDKQITIQYLSVLDLVALRENQFLLEHGASALQNYCASEHCTIGIGWSLGGMLLLDIASSGMYTFEKLIILSSSSCFVRKEFRKWGVLEEVIADLKNGIQFDYDATMKRFYAMTAAPQRNSGYSKAMVRYSNDLSKDSLLDGLSYLSERDLTNQLQTVTCPILVIHGDDDAVVEMEAAQALASGLPHASIVTMPGGHCAPLFANDTTSALILNFINA